MADAMVVARMSQEKKDAVARKLSDLGLNASSAINQLYDYIERTGTLPFDEPERQDDREEREAAARAWLGGLRRLPEGNAFQTMTDEQIRAARLEWRMSKGGGAL